MKIIKFSLMSLGAVFVIFALLALRPVMIVSEEKCNVVTGEVTAIYEGGPQDVVFHLKDNPMTLYINRGLEQGLNLETLKEDLVGQSVTIHYPPHWTPLDPNNKFKHISKVTYEGEVVFSEID
ncbi:MAG: hypothetical protein AAF502_25000 [Bacteroidota bacterium]